MRDEPGTDHLGHGFRKAWITASILLAGSIAFHGRAAAQTIQACVKTSSGVIRIIMPGDSCLASEAPMSWSVAGIPGPAGPEGPAGEPGPMGPEGPPGPVSTYARTAFAGPEPNAQGVSVARVFCDPGDLALGGGGGGGTERGHLTASRPIDADGNENPGRNAVGWVAQFDRFSADAFAEVVCADLTP